MTQGRKTQAHSPADTLLAERFNHAFCSQVLSSDASHSLSFGQCDLDGVPLRGLETPISTYLLSLREVMPPGSIPLLTDTSDGKCLRVVMCTTDAAYDYVMSITSRDPLSSARTAVFSAAETSGAFLDDGDNRCLEDSILAALLSQCGVVQLNPFDPQAPALPQVFVGRELELFTIERACNQPLVLTGPSRIGKTSLLRKVQSHLSAKMPCTIITASPALAGTKPSSHANTPPNDLEKFMSVTRCENGPHAVLIDDVDLRFLQGDVFKQLRRWSIDNAGRAIVAVASGAAPAALERACAGSHRIALGCLSPNEATRLLLEPLGALQIKLKEQFQSVEQFLERTQYLPEAIHQVGSAIVRECIRKHTNEVSLNRLGWRQEIA